MPIVTIQITREGTTPEQKASLIKGATDLLADVLNKPPGLTFVTIQEEEMAELGRERPARGGAPASGRGRVTRLTGRTTPHSISPGSRATYRVHLRSSMPSSGASMHDGRPAAHHPEGLRRGPGRLRRLPQARLGGRRRRVPPGRLPRIGQRDGPGLQDPPDRAGPGPRHDRPPAGRTRSVVKLAQTLGRVAWAMDIPSPRAEAYRDTPGPGWRVEALLASPEADDPQGEARPGPGPADARPGAAPGRGGGPGPGRPRPRSGHGGRRRQGEVGEGQCDRLTSRTAAGCGMGRGPRRVRDRVRPARPGRRARLPDRLDAGEAARASKALGLKAGLAREDRPHGLRHEAITRDWTWPAVTCGR